MQRTLIVFGTLLLAGCWHEAFHTSVENGTGRKIYVAIHFEGEKVPLADGYLESGNGVNLIEKKEKIVSIDYQFDDRKCHLERQSIAELPKVQDLGVDVITLRDCGKSDALSGH